MSTFTDWKHMNPDEPARQRTTEREALDTAVAEFLAGGGEVQEIPRGVGIDYTCRQIAGGGGYAYKSAETTAIFRRKLHIGGRKGGLA